MRTPIPLLLLLACTACKADFATVDEACDGKVPGDNKIENATAHRVFERINCYRRLAKIGRASMQPQVQEAVENHAAYQQQNFVVEDWAHAATIEDPIKPGFTGVEAYERLAYTDYYGVDATTMGLWQYTFWDDAAAEDRVDFWFHDPQAREAFLQLSWIAGGFDEGTLLKDLGDEYSDNMAYLNIFYQVPVIEHSASPVIYPKDGQEQVPTTFEAVDGDSPVIDRGEIGYPITVTVGGGDASMVLGPSSLTGPDGDVPLEAYSPATDPWMRSQAAYYPMQPLAPNSEYTFAFEMSWGTLTSRSFTSTFRTGEESKPHGPEAFEDTQTTPPTTTPTTVTSRGTPRFPVIVRHQAPALGH